MTPSSTTEDFGTIHIRIKELVLLWGIHPFDINNGHCEEFAEIIVQEINGARIEWGEESESLFGPEYSPDLHCYVVLSDKYYDAEEPYGVDSPNKLPLYHRQADQIHHTTQ